MDDTARDPYDPKKLDTYAYAYSARDRHPHWIRRALWFSAGADSELLRACPRSEQVKEEGIGGIVLATTMLAFLSGSYALYVVFGPKVGLALSAQQQQTDWSAALVAICFGAVWATIIFNLDRFVVSSTGHGDGTENMTLSEIFKSLPRIIMAMIIGLCLSAPLEIRVMQSEIEAELNVRQREMVEKKVRDHEENVFKKSNEFLEGRRAELAAKVKKMEDETQRLQLDLTSQYNLLNDEAAGKNPNAMAGTGPRYQAALKILDQKKTDLEGRKAESAKDIARIREEIAGVDTEIKAARAGVEQARTEARDEAAKQDGLFTRIKLAHEIGGMMSLVLAGLLMIIEVGPIFFKMMMIRGPYLALLDNQNEIVRAKFAIVAERAIEGGDAAHGHGVDRYHRAETIREFEVGQLEAERQLSNLARRKFVEMTEGDIQTNPSRYVSGG